MTLHEDDHPWANAFVKVFQHTGFLYLIGFLGACTTLCYGLSHFTGCEASHHELKCANDCGRQEKGFYSLETDSLRETRKCICQAEDGSGPGHIW